MCGTRAVLVDTVERFGFAGCRAEVAVETVGLGVRWGFWQRADSGCWMTALPEGRGVVELVFARLAHIRMAR